MNFFALFFLTFASASPEAVSSRFDSLEGTVELKLREHALPPRYDECHLCHTKKARRFVKRDPNPKKEHDQISPVHGKRKMSCNMCHDINNYNYLVKTEKLPADFSNSSPVCARCHMEKFRDWKRGFHGKRMGGWNRPEVQFHCIDCHHPHGVIFPSMDSVAAPELSPHVIQHGSDEKEHK